VSLGQQFRGHSAEWIGVGGDGLQLLVATDRSQGLEGGLLDAPAHELVVADQRRNRVATEGGCDGQDVDVLQSTARQAMAMRWLAVAQTDPVIGSGAGELRQHASDQAAQALELQQRVGSGVVVTQGCEGPAVDAWAVTRAMQDRQRELIVQQPCAVAWIARVEARPADVP